MWGFDDPLVGFVCSEKESQMWVAHWRPAGLCARFYSCLFVPLFVSCVPTPLLNLFHRLHRFHVISRVELRGEADES